MILTEEQQSALNQLIEFTKSDKREFALVGAAGCGKTTVIKELTKHYSSHEIVFTAPTNKAVKVLSSMGDIEKIEHCTIHALLGLRVKSQNGEELLVKASKSTISKLAEYKLVVIDEMSMISKQLHEFISNAMNSAPYTRIIYLGDPQQLPPINEDISKTFSCDYAELSTIMRQAELSPVKEWCNAIRQTIKDKSYVLPPLPLRENLYLVSDTKLPDMFKKAFSGGANDTRIIAFRNSVVDDYNRLVQSLLHPHLEGKFAIGERLTFRKPLCKLGITKRYSYNDTVPDNFDELILPIDAEVIVVHVGHIENYESQYGNIPCFTLEAISSEDSESSMLINVAVDDNIVNRHKKLLADAKLWDDYYSLNAYFPTIKLCYAGTSHTSQGCSYKNVFIDLQDILNSYNKRDAFKCLYVAASRSSKNLIVINK
jgi:hypothetical protein